MDPVRDHRGLLSIDVIRFRCGQRRFRRFGQFRTTRLTSRCAGRSMSPYALGVSHADCLCRTHAFRRAPHRSDPGARCRTAFPRPRPRIHLAQLAACPRGRHGACDGNVRGQRGAHGHGDGTERSARDYEGAAAAFLYNGHPPQLAPAAVRADARSPGLERRRIGVYVAGGRFSTSNSGC